MKKLMVPITLVLISVLLFTGCGIVKDVAKAGNDFMVALRDGNAQQSWGMLTTSVQNEIGGYDAWTQFAAPRAFASWSFSDTQVVNDTAQMDGEGLIGSDTYTIRLVFAKVGTEWKISGINITLK